jgi:predicted PurR-regulated permease PerM
MDQLRPGNHPDHGPERTILKLDLLDLAKRSAVVWAVGLLIVLLVVGIGYAIDVLLLAFAGVLFAILLRSLSDLLNRFARLGENWSLTAAGLLLAVFVAAGTWLVIPRIAAQADQLQQSLPRSVVRLEEQVKRYEWGRWLWEKTPEPNDLIPRQRDLFSRLTGVVSGTLSALGVVIVVVFTGLYLAAQHRLYTEGIVKLVAIGKRDRAREVIAQIGSALKWWLVGKLVAMVFVGVLTWLGLWLLQVDLALTLAVLAALLTFVPNFGPIIAAVPAVLLALLHDSMTAAWVVMLYIAIQLVESYLITPLIQQQTVSLPPALTITTQLLMAAFVGGIGLALATPMTVVVLVLVQSLYVHDALGDREIGST